MKIYFSHSKKINYHSIYKKIRKNNLNKHHTIYLPHEKYDEAIKTPSKNIIKNCDLIIAETSFSATGLGIELWWANSFWIKIICFYKKWSKQSWSLKVVCDNFISYSSEEDFIKKINTFVKK